jgi:transcriptional regulator with XRE-family HTH domain
VETLRIAFGRACLDARLSLDVSRTAVAERVGVSTRYLAMIEAGTANPSLRLAESLVAALGLEAQLVVRPPIFPAGTLVHDSVHARCSAYADRRLQAAGWRTRREVEVVSGRPHGWIDLLAFDPITGTLLIIEIKTTLDDFGALERQLSWYERLAPDAAHRVGWRTRRTVSIVLALATEEVERIARAHRSVLAVAFPERASSIRALVANPGSPMSGRGFALIDPRSRRRDWLVRTTLDGRRSRLPYRSYAEAGAVSG